MNQNPSPLSTLTPLQRAYYVFTCISEIQKITEAAYEASGFVIDDINQLEPAAVSQENDKLRTENQLLREQLSEYRRIKAIADANSYLSE